MRLDSRRVFSLRQNLKQLIIRQEIESWEGVTLCLQILTKSFLYLLEQLVTFSKIVEQSSIRTDRYHLRMLEKCLKRTFLGMLQLFFAGLYYHKLRP